MSKPQSAVEFDCRFGIAEIVGEMFYTCFPEVTNDGESNLLETVESEHQPGKSNDDVECLAVLMQVLTFFPGNIDGFFRNLKILEFFNTNLLSISSEDLEPFPSLFVFAASSNKLTSIDGNLFKHNPKLKFISLACNQIQEVGFDLLKDLKDLKEFLFKNNPCIDVNSYGRTEILNLNEKLKILCPPIRLSTKSQQKCSNSCPKRTLSTEENRNKPKELINEQNREIEMLYERLVELERKVRKITFV